MWPEKRGGTSKLGLSTGGDCRRQVALWAVPESRTNAQLIGVRRLNESAEECAQERIQGPRIMWLRLLVLLLLLLLLLLLMPTSSSWAL